VTISVTLLSLGTRHRSGLLRRDEIAHDERVADDDEEAVPHKRVDICLDPSSL
jgi:hypothetical protein